MPNPEPDWMRGLQADVDSEAVYRPFRHLLTDFLPMSQETLGGAIGKDRTTVGKWTPGRTPLRDVVKATLDQQAGVAQAVRARLGEIGDQVKKVEEMIKALRQVEAAHGQHMKSLDEKTLTALRKANDKVRAFLEVADE